MMATVKIPVAEPSSASREDRAKERLCLKCRKAFDSEGFGERICPRCKSLTVWRNPVPNGPVSRRTKF